MVNEFIVTKVRSMLNDKASCDSISKEMNRIFTDYYLEMPIVDKVRSLVKIEQKKGD